MSDTHVHLVTCSYNTRLHRVSAIPSPPKAYSCGQLATLFIRVLLWVATTWLPTEIQRWPHANQINNEHATAYVKTLRAAAHAKRQQVIPRDHIESEIDHGWGWVSDYASDLVSCSLYLVACSL